MTSNPSVYAALTVACALFAILYTFAAVIFFVYIMSTETQYQRTKPVIMVFIFAAAVWPASLILGIIIVMQKENKIE